MHNQRKQTDGVPVRVCDCYIWAEISYLDSPTDYRECLPQACPQPPEAGADLVMLDSNTGWPEFGSLPAWTIAALLLLVAAVVSYINF
jgi:hypothetical protein